jgi:phospholipid/cholesterol/gamma-HCH transport system substrate-binding protein
MKFSIRFADKIVGSLVILALAILVVVVLMIGKGQRWFMKDYYYLSYFDSASGLSANMAVQYKGFTIGFIKKIKLADNDSVEVTFTIFEEHQHRVTEGSLVERRASPIGLGNSFIFYPGKGTKELDEWSVIPDITSEEATVLARAGLADKPETNDSIGNIISNVEEITTDLKKITNDVSITLEPVLSDVRSIVGDLTEQIAPIIANLEILSGQLSSPSGAVMTLLDEKGPLLDNISKTLNSISGVMKSLESTAEFIPTQLPQIMITISQLNSTLLEVQKTVQALNNNPLLKGGIPEVKESSPGSASTRDLEF